MCVYIITIYTSSKKTKNILKVSLLGAAVCVVSSLILVKLVGLQGASIAMLLGYSTIFIYSLIDTRKIMKFYIDYKALVTILLLLVLEAVIIILDMNFSFIIASIIVFIILFTKRRSIIKVLNH